MWVESRVINCEFVMDFVFCKPFSVCCQSTELSGLMSFTLRPTDLRSVGETVFYVTNPELFWDELCDYI